VLEQTHNIRLFMVALCNRETIYIFMLWFVLLLSFFSSPNLSRCRLDVYHTSAHGVVLVMVALCNRADHYIFMLWFVLLSSSFFLFFLA